VKSLKKKWIIIVGAIVLIACVSIIVILQSREKPGDLPDWIPRMIVTGPSGETITFQNGGVTLAGVLDLPAGNRPFPAIVTVHGSPPLTRNDRYNLYISDLLSTTWIYRIKI
jgi:dipeptidyl aminopeptidase/acylaminoacyl peptidase